MAGDGKRPTRKSPAGGSRTRPAAAAASPVSPPVPELAGKSKDLAALRTAVIDAASVGAGLWFSYLFVLLYLLIAAGSVTHRDLLLQSPIKLPFLGVELPLVGFFGLGPLLFIVVHAYVLLHFVLLADKVGVFHAELRNQIGDSDVRERLQRQLPSNIFVQFLAGPHDVRAGVIGFMLRLIAQISLVVGPIALLIFLHFQFLPYHLEWLTWWHRLALVADLALLWLLWPSVARGRTSWIAWRDLRHRVVAACAVASVASVLLVVTVATFPGERLDALLPSVKFVPTKWPDSFPKAEADTSSQQEATEPSKQAVAGGAGDKAAEARKTTWLDDTVHAIKDFAGRSTDWFLSMGWSSPHQLLVAGDVDLVAGRRKSLWSNTLVLPDEDVIAGPKFDTEEKIRAVRRTISLRGRQLEGALLLGARLRKVDFTGAQLRRAVLNNADLREAKFECIEVLSDLNCADLAGSYLENAQLQGASLEGATLSGAYARRAQLQGANLHRAKLHGATLTRANLQGAALYDALLYGAGLDGAQLQGADLRTASMQGASFESALLHGAMLANTRLEGASFKNAELSGAVLDGAQLQGAILDGARLTAASFGEPKSNDATTAADRSPVFVWRADPRKIKEGLPRIGKLIKEPVQFSRSCPEPFEPCPWSKAIVDRLKTFIEKWESSGFTTSEALERIAVLDPANPVGKNDDAVAEAWTALERRSPAPAEYENTLVTVLRDAGCDAAGAPHVLHRLIDSIDPRHFYYRFEPSSPHPARLAADFLDEAKCPGTRGLSEQDKVRLTGIQRRATTGSASVQ